MESDGAEEQVGYQLRVLDRLVRKKMEADMRKMGYDNMTLINGWIIAYLTHNEENAVYQKDLERQFRIGKSSMSTTLKIMEEKGFIKRLAVEGNARVKQVVLTEEARKFHCRMERSRRDMECQVTEGLTREERELFFRVVKKMQDNLMKE